MLYLLSKFTNKDIFNIYDYSYTYIYKKRYHSHTDEYYRSIPVSVYAMIIFTICNKYTKIHIK